MSMERIDKILSNYGGLSRTEAKQYIKNGRVKVNGEIVKDIGLKINDNDAVSMDGKQLNISKYRYFLLNKPYGYISSTEMEPGSHSPNVISLFKDEGIKGLFPVGRLDKDTTGLMLVTNDGELGHRLTAPGRHVDKEYLALVRGQLNDEAVLDFKRGFDFKEFSSAPAKLDIVGNFQSIDDIKKRIELKCSTAENDGSDISQNKSDIYRYKSILIRDFIDEIFLEKRNISEAWSVSSDSDTSVGYSIATVTITEGKFHQVKRMFLKVGCEVLALKRISIGKLILDESLKQGTYRELSSDKIYEIFS